MEHTHKIYSIQEESIMAKSKKYINLEHRTTLEDAQIERAFLVALLGHVAATGYTMTLRNVLDDDDFSDDDNQRTWQYCKGCLDKGQEVNMVNVYAQAKEAEQEWTPSRYVMTKGTDGDIITLASLVHNMGLKRRMSVDLGDVMMSLEHQPDYSPAEAVADIEEVLANATKQVKPKVSAWRTIYKTILTNAEKRARGEIPMGTLCGFDLIDRKGGMERGELMIIAGRNSNGKTSFALCCAVGVAQRGTPVGIFSLEMTNEQLGTRILSLTTGVDGERIKKADMAEQEWDNVVSADDTLPIYFDEVRSADIDTIIGNIKAMQAQHGVQVVVIDYLQLLRSKERERVQQIGGIAHRLEALSKQLEITIILISQLRRNVDKDPTPRLEELKESGDIADAADSVYLVYRPERHGKEYRYPDMSQNWSTVDTHGTALLMCCKNRQGAMEGEQLLAFDAATTRFYQKESYKPAERIAGKEYDVPF